MSKLKQMLPILSASLFSYPFSVHATEPSPVTLDTVLVTAPSVETTTTAELSKFGSKVEVITRDEIEKAGPSADITRVLEMYVPGLYVAPQRGPFDYAKYSLLGGRDVDILILLDGVRLNNRLYGGLYIDTIPTTAVERIEVLKGGQSLFFGTEAVSGVINIVTRTPRSSGVSGEVSAGLDTWGGFSGEGRVETSLSDALGRVDVMGFASENISHGYKPFRDSDYVQPNTHEWRGYQVSTAGTKLGQDLDQSNAHVELFYQVTKAKLDYVYPARNNDTYNDRTQQIASLTFQQQPTDWLNYFIKSHVNSWDTDYTKKLNTPTGEVNVVYNKSYWGFIDYGVQAQGEATLPGGHVLAFGTDTQWYSGHDDVLIIQNNTAEAYGFYSQFRPAISALPDWHPAIGVRHEIVSGGSEATVWNVSNRYDLNKQLSLRGQVGTSFRLPTAEELFANESDDIGNRNLKPEKSLNFEVGGDYNGTIASKALRSSVTLYRRIITDLISQNDSYQYVNAAGSVTTKGINIDAQIQLTPNWHLGANVDRFTMSSGGDNKIYNIPQSTLRGRFGYDADDRRWGAELVGRYVGNISNASNVDYGGYAVFDANAYIYVDAAKTHQVSLLVENLFDRQYATYQTSNGINRIPYLGRPLTAELRYKLTF